MRVSELARRAGASASSIRWYGSVGLLPPPGRHANGYRDYGDVDLARVRLLVALRHLGLAPREAARLARRLVDEGGDDLDLSALLVDQRRAIRERRAELERLEDELLDLERTIMAAGAAGRKEPRMTDRPIRVLFVCTHNSARSQIAEALLRHYGGADFEAHSAGTEVRAVNPYAVRVLADLGIDWSTARSKLVGEFLDQHFDYVITVCDRARETCPVFPGSENTLHWGLDDPSSVTGDDAERLAAFRRTEVEISARLRPFIEVALRAAGRGRRAALP